MLQTTFRTDSDSADECIIVPIGIIRLIRSGFKRYGFHDLMNSFKDSGVPMGIVIENLCIASLDARYSMNDLDEFINRNELRKEFYCHGFEIRRWTMDRDLQRLGDYLEEVVMHIGKVMRFLDPDGPTHAYIDGSHIRRFGSKGTNVRYGEGGGTIQLQDQFMLATGIAGGIPVSAELYPGNENDPSQYSDFIPQLMFLLKRGSLVVMDNGGASSTILDEIVGYGNAYLTRVRINSSDEKTIENSLDKLVYMGMGTACIMHTFQSSQRTTYLFFSVDSYAAGLLRAQKAVKDLDAEREKAKKVLGSGKTDKLIKTVKSPFFEVIIENARVVMTEDPWVEIDPSKKLSDAIPTKSGWFKLECSFPMDPRLALTIYRHRVDIEYAISILKSTINVAPLRVWDEGSTRGKLVLGLIVEFILFMAINDAKPENRTKIVDGKPVEVPFRPSPRTVVRELRRYEGIVKPRQWGPYEVEHIRDHTTLDSIVEVLNRYDSEGPLKLPEGQLKLTIPTAQWGRGEKNCQDLAMSIAQFFSETIFPEVMGGRRHWKDIDPVAIGRFKEPLRIDSTSDGAESLRGRQSYYGSAVEDV